MKKTDNLVDLADIDKQRFSPTFLNENDKDEKTSCIDINYISVVVSFFFSYIIKKKLFGSCFLIRNIDDVISLTKFL